MLQMDPGFCLALLNGWLENAKAFFLRFLYSVHMEQSPAILWKNLLVLRWKLGHVLNTLASGSVLNHL